MKKMLPSHQPAVVALGTFDGVHRGHEQLIKTVIAQARLKKCRSVIVTFEAPVGKTGGEIMPLEEKLAVLRSFPIDEIIVLPRTHEILNLSADEFFKTIICGSIHAACFVAGPHVAFGKNRVGNTTWLAAHAHQYGVSVKIVPARQYRGQRISSSWIRRLISLGDLPTAERLLGRPYQITGVPFKGRQIGRKLGFPTINMKVKPGKLLPLGVFVGAVATPQRLLPAVINIGSRPSIERHGDIFPEVHLLDTHKQWKQRTITVFVHKKIRPERHFASREALAAHIVSDVATARSFFRV